MNEKEITNLPSPAPEVQDLKKENRLLKRKLMLAENQLKRIRLAAATQERTESILNASLDKERQYFQLVLGNMTNILLLFDFDGRFAYASDIFLAIAGIKSFGLINGRHFQEVLKPLISETNLANFTSSVKLAIKEKCTILLEERIDFNLRDSLTFSIFVTPMIDDTGKITGIMSLFNDITEINNAMEQAKSANLAKTNFLSNMSHEIRTPLNAIIGMSSIAQNSKDYEQIHYCLDKINDSSKHLLGIINDILDMSKIESSHFELSFSDFIFEEMLTRVLDMMQFKIKEKNITFSLNYDPNIPYSISSDEQRLSQVIMNLLSNAVKFTPEYGNITLEIKAEPRTEDTYILRFSVKDTGIGISEEQKPRLFKVFSQADSSISRKFGGTGLGLVISKNIVEMLDGKMWFESSEGNGATFYFTIVSKIGTLEPEQDTMILNTTEEKEYDDFSTKTILLVDDVEINREIIIVLLKETGIHIINANNGKEAVDTFASAPDDYALIFMDVQMPEMDGYEATMKIRSLPHERAKTVPIIAMTANVFKEDIEHCLSVGMNDHIGKPIDVAELLEKIRHWTQD